VTFAEMVEQVRLRCGISAQDTRMTTYIKSMINSEYARLCAEHSLLEKVGDVSLVANSEYVDLPDDWQKTIQIRTASYVLEPITALKFAEYKTSGYSGRFVYTGEAPERIRILPVPTVTIPAGLTLVYAARPVQLVHDDQTAFAISPAFQPILPALASYHVLLAEESADLAAIALQESTALEGRMAAVATKRDGEGQSKIPPPPSRVGVYS